MAIALTGCDRRPDKGPVIVSAIGGTPALVDAARGRPDSAQKLMVDALAQGLVRFDAAGQIEQGLAERWIVIDGGLTYIFRLRDAEWQDGNHVTADQVVAILKRQIAPGSRNPLAPFLTAIGDIVVMTPQVIEVRLKRPRPDLLKLFAQPELALVRTNPPGGSGPFRIVAGGHSPLLRPAFDRDRADPDDQRTLAPETEVRLIGERASRAIARFAHRDSDLVAGGTFVDWPILAQASIAPANIQVDPAAGLFGLAFADRDGFLADPVNRAAVAQAIDRGAATAAVRPNWASTEQILPEALDSAAPPVVPVWSQAPLADRVAAARAQVRLWPVKPVLRIALPTGPGATLLYGQIAASLIAIGAVPTRVAATADADLRLIDRVAPYDSARWYFANACAPCGAAALTAMLAARDAPTLEERSHRLADADLALAQDVAFIPIARPLRWSLVATRLRQFQPNPRAWHPLNRLRADTSYPQ
ncbi:ABC transporter substrate-binding protein [Sphingomonas bacterium]|uniref:ABC transporter substrate-binding protein n=1 Tax=Sphingomonas bacterium TaxID=1895847 RepID=UPI0020C732C5|nr:ABC transporter substrate-binding protein [Sphingomonas bacterium]